MFELGPKYECNVRVSIYVPAIGDTDSGIKAGTALKDIPDDWQCLLCNVTKEDFIELK